MTDIVERLRNVFPIGWEGEMRHKAADEIERLRAERDAAIREMQASAQQADMMEAREAAARREALEEAAKIALRIEVPTDAGPIDGHARVMASVQIAAAIRALLKENGR